MSIPYSARMSCTAASPAVRTTAWPGRCCAGGDAVTDQLVAGFKRLPGVVGSEQLIIAALVVSIVAAAGSVGAVWYARRSARSSATSAAAAETTAALDSQRRHAELTPRFEIVCTAGNNGVGDHGELRLALAGPTGLERLDEVTVAILDETGADHWARGFPPG
jgi:hypothetical protein